MSDSSMPHPTAAPLTAATTGTSVCSSASAAGVSLGVRASELLTSGRLLASSHHHLDVVAGAERRVGAGDDEAASGRRADGILELGVGAERERVARLGAPQRDHPDVALLFVGEVFVHRSPS